MTYIVKHNRAFGSSAVQFGPFDTVEAAQAWCVESGVDGMIIGIWPPDVDTGPWSEIWSS